MAKQSRDDLSKACKGKGPPAKAARQSAAAVGGKSAACRTVHRTWKTTSRRSSVCTRSRSAVPTQWEDARPHGLRRQRVQGDRMVTDADVLVCQIWR